MTTNEFSTNVANNNENMVCHRVVFENPSSLIESVLKNEDLATDPSFRENLVGVLQKSELIAQTK